MSTKDFPAPPDWPLFGLNPAQWYYFEKAGYDMRAFFLIRPIPRLSD